jgi:hypothetical protein
LKTIFPVFERKVLENKTSALFIAACLLMPLPADLALAKRGGGDENRSEYYGIVQARPHNGRQGEWVIGGRTFIVDQGTEFDETEGLLSVGRCTKVHVRNGHVHEIDSEPKQDCQ